jgi:hypothetical protein
MALLVNLVNYSKSYAQRITFDFIKNIEQYEQELSRGKRANWDLINGAYSMYGDRLQKIANSNRPDLVIKGIKEMDDRFGETTDRLIKLMDLIKKKDPMISKASWFVNFENAVNSIYEGAEHEIKSGESSLVYSAYWRLAAIKSYKDSETKIKVIKPKVEEFVASAKRQGEEERALERKKRDEEARQRAEMEAKTKELRIKEEREAEVRRKAEAEKRKAEGEKRKAKLAKYNVKAEVSPAELRKNPYKFEGKVILLTGVMFDRMLKKGLAVFVYKTISVGWVRTESVVSSSEEALLVSKVPVDFSLGYADLIVKCKGTTEVTNALGGTITLPLVEYIAVCE